MSRWNAALTLALALVIPGGLIAQPATSSGPIEQWDRASFVQYCRSFLDDPASNEGMLCRGYLLGFMAGAAAVQQSVAPTTGDETFSERAARTRAGTLIERERLRALPWFCLNTEADSAALTDIVATALSHVDADPASSSSNLAVTLRRALAQSLPCDSD